MAKSGKHSWREKLNFEELYQTVTGLGPREQILTFVGIGLVVLLLIVIPISCASSRLNKLEAQIENHEKNVDEVVKKINEYKSIVARKNQLDKMVKPKSEVQLTTRLESLATQSGIGSNIDSLKEKPGTPGEDFEELVVAVRLSKLSLNQIIQFLYDIETQKDLALKVTRLQVKPRYDNRQQLDADFDVSTLVSTQANAVATEEP